MRIEKKISNFWCAGSALFLLTCFHNSNMAFIPYYWRILQGWMWEQRQRLGDGEDLVSRSIVGNVVGVSFSAITKVEYVVEHNVALQYILDY